MIRAPYFNEMTTGRNRKNVFTVSCVILLLGLGSRSSLVPTVFLRTYAGDTLWTMMVYAAAALLFPRARPLHLCIGALSVSVAVELTQLYHAPWIDGLRSTRVGGLVLGYGFLWSDLACYTVGASTALFFDATALSLFNRKGRKGGAKSAEPFPSPPH